MYLLDVNVLVAAHRADHPVHAQVKAWLDLMIDGGDDFGVPLAVWGSFLRIATNRRIFPVPSPVADAFAFIDAVRAQAHALAIEPGERHIALLAQCCDQAGAAGDLVPDAILAAVALENGATIVSLDRDFARFPGLRVISPAP